MSDSAEPPGPPSSPRAPRNGVPTPPRRHFDAVLFDFHGTLAQVEDPVQWVTAAAARCGTRLSRPAATALADRLVAAGRAGGPPPVRIPPHLAEVYAERDLDGRAHRAAFTGLAATVECAIDGLPQALYDRLVRPEGWDVAPDAVPTLAALRTAGIPVAVVSNIGFDIRPLTRAGGLHPLIRHYVLSYEVGRLKPDPSIFLSACAVLGVPPERTLMVGDTPADAGAVAAGCRAYVIPTTRPGRPAGLSAVLSLVRAHPDGG